MHTCVYMYVYVHIEICVCIVIFVCICVCIIICLCMFNSQRCSLLTTLNRTTRVPLYLRGQGMLETPEIPEIEYPPGTWSGF